MTVNLSKGEIEEYLLSPDRDPYLATIVKSWYLLKEEQKKELIEIISKYMLQNQAEELREEKG